MQKVLKLKVRLVKNWVTMCLKLRPELKPLIKLHFGRSVIWICLNNIVSNWICMILM